jgi:hypothetical protein
MFVWTTTTSVRIHMSLASSRAFRPPLTDRPCCLILPRSLSSNERAMMIMKLVRDRLDSWVPRCFYPGPCPGLWICLPVLPTDMIHTCGGSGCASELPIEKMPHLECFVVTTTACQLNQKPMSFSATGSVASIDLWRG